MGVSVPLLDHATSAFPSIPLLQRRLSNMINNAMLICAAVGQETLMMEGEHFGKRERCVFEDGWMGIFLHAKRWSASACRLSPVLDDGR